MIEIAEYMTQGISEGLPAWGFEGGISGTLNTSNRRGPFGLTSWAPAQ